MFTFKLFAPQSVQRLSPTGAAMSLLPRIAALALVSAFIMPVSATPSQSSFQIGQRLSAEQIKQLGALKSVEVNGRSYQVVATLGTTPPATLLVGRNGVVGQSFHELLITGQPTDAVRQQLAAVLSNADAVKYYDEINTAVVRYSDIDKAVTALTQIRAAMPEAKVALPIVFSPTKLH